MKLFKKFESFPKTQFFMLFSVKYLGHEFGFSTNTPTHPKVAGIHELPSPPKKLK